jgi:transposase/AcrR family transcriptional regulator
MSDHDPKPARGRPRTMNAEKVLDVAMTAYWQSDPADVSVNAICQMAGISKPSLYREFGSEDGLSRAVLDRYAEQVLSEMFVILHGGKGLRETLDALIDFASDDPRMETGCLFYKMRAGKHRLGPETRARVEEIDAAAQAAYAAFLQAARDAGEWPDGLSVEAGAKYLGEQIALAITQRASGEDPARIREMLTLALSVFNLNPDDLIFIDETWTATNMGRTHGRCRRGERLRMGFPHGHRKTTTLVAGLSKNGMVAPMTLDGPINGEWFEAYVRHVLLPELRPGNVVIMDNLSSHKRPAVGELIEAAGATLMFLPPYSPDFNPIEMAFAKLKALLRKAAERTIEGLWERIGDLIDVFTPQECANYFATCGYDAD